MEHYFFLFLGLLVGGESVLIPAAYLSLIGKLSIAMVIFISTLATMMSDTFWYAVGRKITHERISRMRLLRRHHDGIKRAGKFIARYGVIFLVISKFVYGTRTATQILSGLERIPYSRYMAFNFIGIVIYTSTIFGIGYAVRESLEQFKLTIITFQASFAAIFFIVIGTIVWINYKFSRRWFR